MKIYLVGGAVRDSLLNLPVKDKDWVVVGGTEKILLERNFQQVGKDFPVFLHPETHEEYALARKERKSGKGYTGFDTDCNSDVTLEEDLIRRDLTINAIAQDEYGNYIDPFQGKKDIECGLIRHVSESFIEDPLRVLRVARFAATLVHLGFKIAEETMLLMCIIVKKQELSYLTSNRIWNETEKALKTLNPHVYFQVLYECNALHFFFPEMYFLYEKKNFLNRSFFKKFCNKNIILMGLAEISLLNKDIDVRFSYLCQFLSVNQIDRNYSKIFFDSYAASIIHSVCKRFKIPSYIRDIAVLNTGFYFFLNTIHYQSSKNIINLFSKVDAWRKPDRVKKLAFLSNFNFLRNFKSEFFCIKSGCFLEKCFSVVKNVSIKLILKKGFKGYEIKQEITRLRIKKLEFWRIKNIKHRFYL
ncbi:tRNA CCA-pyrophosphorylase [Buchnera aphidicola str. APS (Acyrthosiphon pisum)]|uniref:CCA-adding enzyme n=2 Tax=Buchnera aphidicola TaxID=9 RepID=CCA_BUCAI|nr:tRNA CCA-pyrophosphorylase [Buchnera aphidicola]B8D8L9.1 RecName: Full=CCA-adding enzyme; AltName: Full=CCA tRNA nucleotidyltransferase; AltName: Full=tRNA CCA-pyrophosphorylase; AltName: Full=tRNA adenylyl-/cytidylyl- transferase; AltName: Full=tRNA nucleotidyltransferase; AltName: Full=tRNA-NT [Buchnera aphidicola str. 5A (Acyrthosiphon pisum)]P57169.1 RecName: Full=CCA-adding enzyme; AltName: Full=CCA tRNA nucleotidyltransferase; AltName: Full=tRNA CCA-pyrophosphorylase; AltName: Full=tRNA 